MLKPPHKPGDPAQLKQFMELAKKLGADETDADLRSVLKRLGNASESHRLVDKKPKGKSTH